MKKLGKISIDLDLLIKQTDVTDFTNQSDLNRLKDALLLEAMKQVGNQHKRNRLIDFRGNIWYKFIIKPLLYGLGAGVGAYIIAIVLIYIL